MVTPNLLCISDALALRLIQSISRNIGNEKKSFETIMSVGRNAFIKKVTYRLSYGYLNLPTYLPMRQ